MTKLLINIGNVSWHCDMTKSELEDKLSFGDEFIELPLLLDGRKSHTIKARPSAILYYYEEL